MPRAVAFAKAAVTVGLALTLTGCSAFGSGRSSDEGSPAEHEALEAFFEDPLFTATPPSTGEVLEESEQGTCREASHEPGASRTYELVSDGQDVADFYKDKAENQGWHLVEENPVDPNAPFAGRRASLFFERSEGDFTLRMWVDFGLGLTSREPTVSVGGGVTDASFCS